jgi:hypothetical protein
MAKHATIDEYIAAIPEPLRGVAAKARAVVDAELEGASSAIEDVDRALFAGWLRQARGLELAAQAAG